MKATGLTILILAASLAGCGPDPYQPPISAYLRPELMGRVHRVVLVELAADNCEPEMASLMTEAIHLAATERQLFHVDLIRRDDSRCEGLNLDCREGSTYAELSAIRKALGAEAVLLGAVRQFDPYRMKAALDLRLLDLKNGKLIWRVDHVWDSCDSRVEKRLRQYAEQNVRDGCGPAPWRLALVSPRAFAQFVAWEASWTMVEPHLRPRQGLLRPTGQAIVRTAKNLTDYP